MRPIPLLLATLLLADAACHEPGAGRAPPGAEQDDPGDATTDTEPRSDTEVGETDATFHTDRADTDRADTDRADTDPGSPATVPYDADGTVPYSRYVDHVSNGGQTWDVTTWLPDTAGTHPVVSFWCGTQQTSAGYAPYARRLASWGIGMSIVDDPGVLTQTGDMVPTAVWLVDTWLPTRFPGKIDVARVGLSGHSRGGALTLFAADAGLRGKAAAWLGLDAVDNPLQNPDLARDILPGIGIPSGFLGAAVATDCAPTSANYATLYPLAPSPSVLVAFRGANHVQFEAQSGCTLCGLCMPYGTARDDVVLAHALRYFTAFFARELLGDATVGAAFEGVGAADDVAARVVTVRSK